MRHRASFISTSVLVLICAVFLSGLSGAREVGSSELRASGAFGAKKNQRIAVFGSPFGRMIYNGSRQAIYVFDQDSARKSRCYGGCARAWPPVLTKGKPKAIRGARQSLIGTFKRKGGARQVTYAGQPLYFYAHEGPGQVFCHDIFLNGGLWLAIQPNGQPLP